MSHKALQQIVGQAVRSDSFRGGILGGGRRMDVIDAFLKKEGLSVTDEERAELLKIQATTLAEFGEAIEAYINTNPEGKLLPAAKK